jgi:hypothetical protein
MQVTAKTGSLDIEGDRRGRVHFREGRVTGAELAGAKGSYIGEDRGGIADILYVLSALDGGSFSVGAADGPGTKGWTVEEIISEVDALQSLEGEVVDAGLFEAAGVRLVHEIGQPLTIDPEDWHVLATLVSPFTFGDLESLHGRGGAVRIFHTLHRMGMAEAVVGDEGESDWLDRLAEDVAPDASDPAWIEHLHEEEENEGETDIDPTPEPDGVSVESVEPDDSREREALKGVSAPAETTLTDGVYDEIRRLRSRVSDG